MDSDERFFERALRRISRSILVLALAGTAALFLWGGWRWGTGFAAGAAASWLNFRWLKQLVDALGGRRPRARLVFFLAARYLLLGAGAYAILRYSEISLSAALAGLFVPVAAVLFEILFELVYARE
jgi:hypothetical protein